MLAAHFDKAVTPLKRRSLHANRVKRGSAMIPMWDIDQGSDAWFAEKAGKPGASSFDRIITTRGEPSKQRTDYIFQLAAERIVGREVDGYTNAAMQRGTALEPEGRALFEFITGLELKQVGLVYRDESRRVLCSPDGLILDNKVDLPYCWI